MYIGEPIGELNVGAEFEVVTSVEASLEFEVGASPFEKYGVSEVEVGYVASDHLS